MSNDINKARIWCGITYPENMVDDWQVRASDLLQGIPYAYCIHDKDKSGHKGDRKEHVHWILSFKDLNDGTTTKKHVTNVFNLLSKPGKQCAIPAEACLNVAHAWDYLIHDTESARKEGKYQYPESERVTGNNFDLDRLITLTTAVKLQMLREMCDFVHERQIMDLDSLYEHIGDGLRFGEDYFQIYSSNNALLDRLCRGVFNKRQRKISPIEAPKCSICGSAYVIGSYRSENGLMWYCQDCQETAYRILEELEGYEEGDKDD